MNLATSLPPDFQPYACPPKFCVITSYFNPNRYRTKRANYEIFRESLEISGIRCLTVECVFNSDQPELPSSNDLMRIHARDVMWQKERLVNLALTRLPAACEFAAWLDCDVLFANRNWAVEACAALESHAIVQLFSDAVRLPRCWSWESLEGDRWQSFGSILKRSPNLLLAGDFALHGHTGFAWAGRADVLRRHLLYDACIAGSGDHMMAHAFAGDWSGACIDRIVGRDNGHRSHFEAWASSIFRDVRARVSAVSGTLYHLWHGEIDHRRYVLRNRQLAGFDFDPRRDLRLGIAGAWEWASEKPSLHAWAADYFGHRCEDGVDDQIKIA